MFSTRSIIGYFSIRTGLAALVLCGCIFSNAKAQARSECQPNALEKAEELSALQQYAAAIALLEPCLPNDIVDPWQQKRAYKLVALGHLSLGNEAAAKSAVESLLQLEREYQPDVARDPEGFQKLVEDTKSEMHAREAARSSPARKKGGISKWWWIGGGSAVLVGGSVLVYLLSRTEPLPDPPGDPR